MINSLRSILQRATKTTARIIKPRRVHQIQITHPRRFNAYKVAGYSFGALTALILGPIVLWPIADVWLLPTIISQTLSQTPSTQYSNIWGRDFEISQLEYMMQSQPNNIWILNGNTNCGKTAFVKKLLSLNSGIIYVDLRHFFDGNAFVFEMIDCLYNSAENNKSIINKLVGCYVKLFCFVTTIIAQSDQHITAMLYFHALLNHLKAGCTKYNKKNKQFPLIVFDHFEALQSAANYTKETQNREMLSFIIYSISQFATSICHDLGLSHVLFAGHDLSHDLDASLAAAPRSSITKHCEYWHIAGINKEIAIKYIIKEFEKKLNDDNNKHRQELNGMALELINCIGTNAFDISVALKAVTSNIIDNNNESTNGIKELDKNIIHYIKHYNELQTLKLNKMIKNKDNIKKLQTFITNNNDSLMEWNQALNHFDNDRDLMVNLINNNILSRKHGKKLSSNLIELMEMKLLGKDDNVYVGIVECCDSLIRN